MIYLLFWLLFGLVGYVTALAIQIEKLSERISRLDSQPRKEWLSTNDYMIGLTGILFGPIALVFILYLHKKGLT